VLVTYAPCRMPRCLSSGFGAVVQSAGLEGCCSKGVCVWACVCVCVCACLRVSSCLRVSVCVGLCACLSVSCMWGGEGSEGMSRMLMCLRLRKRLCLFLSLSMCSFFLLLFTVVQSAGHGEILYKRATFSFFLARPHSFL